MVEKKEGCCCCGGNCDNETMKAAEEKRGQGAAVKILGGGCARCDALESATVQALGELGLELRSTPTPRLSNSQTRKARKSL